MSDLIIERLNDLKDQIHKMDKKHDQANEQITILRIEVAKQKTHLKFMSSVHGLIGGILAALGLKMFKE